LDFCQLRLTPTLLRGTPLPILLFNLQRRQNNWETNLRSPRSLKCTIWPNYSEDWLRRWCGRIGDDTSVAQPHSALNGLESADQETGKPARNSVASCFSQRSMRQVIVCILCTRSHVFYQTRHGDNSIRWQIQMYRQWHWRAFESALKSNYRDCLLSRSHDASATRVIYQLGMLHPQRCTNAHSNDS